MKRQGLGAKTAYKPACRHVIDQLTYTEKKTNFDFCGIKFRGVIDGGGKGIICDLKNMPDATIEKAQFAIWARSAWASVRVQRGNWGWKRV